MFPIDKIGGFAVREVGTGIEKIVGIFATDDDRIVNKRDAARHLERLCRLRDGCRRLRLGNCRKRHPQSYNRTGFK